MYTQQNPESIQEMFGNIAARYDRTNKVISMGLHKKWNQLLIKEIEKYPVNTLLDICCGTGDTSFPFLAKRKESKGILLDFCPEMVEIAKAKCFSSYGIEPHRVSYIVGDAQAIPLENASVEAVTVAYGIRNVKNPAAAVKEAYRVLKKGGVFGILELTRPKILFLRGVHKLYLTLLIPFLGGVTSKNKNAYSYLSRSISSFICADSLERVLMDSGFEKTWQQPLLRGAATLIFGRK